MTQAIAITVLVLFAAGMLLIGFYSKKRANSIDGFLLGGRRMGPWVSAIAYGTSYFSAVIFIGYAGKHGWDVGLGSLWIGIGNALIAALASWLLLASRTRSMTRRLNSRTMPEFFGSRYASDGMKVFAAVIIFIFLVPYAASVYKGLGVMFSAVFPGMPEWSCMLIVAAADGRISHARRICGNGSERPDTGCDNDRRYSRHDRSGCSLDRKSEAFRACTTSSQR